MRVTKSICLTSPEQSPNLNMLVNRGKSITIELRRASVWERKRGLC